MTNLLARILLSIMVFPLGGMLYVLTAFAVGLNGRGPATTTISLCVAAVVTGAFVIVYWLWLWRHSVRWTRSRIGRTGLSVLVCALLGVAISLLTMKLSARSGGAASFCVFIGGASAIILWLVLAIVLWRETPMERAERLRQSADDVLFFPSCGYNMTGLYESRCPECGRRFTLNQLYAAQHRQELADAAVARE